MRRDDWLLQQLPVAMVEDDFLARFLRIFQVVATKHASKGVSGMPPTRRHLYDGESRPWVPGAAA